DLLDRAQREAWVVIEEDALHPCAAARARPGDADETDDRALPGELRHEARELRGGVDRRVGQAGIDHRAQPPDTGGKNSTARAGSTAASSPTIVSSMQARVDMLVSSSAASG